MDPLQRLLELLKPGSEAESTWIKALFTFITEHLSPVTCGPSPPAADGSDTGELSVFQLSVSVVQQIQERMCVAHSLPVSYRLLSVSELVSQQHLACVSNLSWSTNQQRAWAREAELSVPGQRALPKVNLLLIGCLREGRGGEWRLTDSSGSVRCECLSPSPLWLNRPVFLPHWNYIPQNASGQDEAGGCVELIGPPVLLCPGPEQGLAASVGAVLINALGVREAAGLLLHRVRGRRLAVWGQVGSVCPLLVVAGTTFFCFTLTDQSQSVPVLVKDSSRLCWSQCVHVGQSVCVTALRVCVLRGWRGNNILCVTERSELHTDYTPTHTDYTPTHAHTDYTPTHTDYTPTHTHTDYTPTHTDCTPTHTDYTPTHTQEHTHTDYTPTHTQEHTHTDYTPTHTQEHTPAGMDTPLLMMSHSDDDSEEAEPSVQSGVRMKQSRVISYQGTVTEVVSEGAGLYVIDGKVGLCVAYQPTVRRKLRAGDQVELHHVHFLFRPCPDFPPSMLCCCLRSSLKVTTFSRLGWAGPVLRCPGDGALPRLLLQGHRGVSEYLWACHLSSQLTHSLVPGVLKQQCVCLLSWRLMETLWGRGGQRRRDIYSEMLDEPHTCPLTQYTVDSAVPQYISISELCQSLQLDSWSSVSLRSLLPPDGQSLSSSEIDAALSWSCRTLSSYSGDSLRRRPLLLVGVLDFPSQMSELKQTLQLRDATGGVACVATETSEDDSGGQRASYNTAWIGCLVCVRQFTMVTERFLQSDFPSYQHLDQEKFITDRQTRVYLQFSLDHLHILSPSVAMVTHLRQKGEESAGDVTAEEEKTADGKRKREETGSSLSASSVTMTTSSVAGSPRPCVSMVIRVEQKEGVAWRNTGAETKEEAGLTLCFSARAAVIGPVVRWGRDPKNEPMTAREAEREGEDKVVLVFSGASARWFPVLHPGCFYRLIAVHTQDPSVLISSGISGQSGVELHTDSTLQVTSDWRFHTLTRPQLLHTCRQVLSSMVLSVSEVLDSRSEVVCFQGLVSERISVRDRTSHYGHTGEHSGVRLTLCDQSGRSLHVYLDLSHTPYPPGLLPGNTLLLSAVQRRQSRTGSVYCRFLPVSSITVISQGETSLAPPPPPAPIMHLGPWALSSEQRCIVGQVKGHVVCFLFLQLQWSCSLCGSVYTQSCCSLQCRSTSSIFQSKAKLVIDDGTGEAHVWFSGALVRSLLGLADSQWEGLQRALRVKGHIRVYPRGRSLVCDGDSDDSLFNFLMCACSSDVICQPISLTCRKHTYLRTQEVRRFSRADRDFVTTLLRPLQLTCQHLH
ncbi:CST complex subunit CTC1 isoform X1 [Amphiprion ocellaris]|uniref:CST complex subunit CTC1 n=2 Tax=Amphiprion ocellaris TaxID=80972 RepID=A0A3Q1BYH1_AMPOC|nr:CST complex subunit CTC1 isoform X1 [Amphiprion ocellaris]